MMKTIKELYIIGPGPSSSHTIGPYKATLDFLKNYNYDYIRVTLYGSLALTGKGHLTDKIIKSTIGDIKNDILFNIDEKNLIHPNTMVFEGYMNNALINRAIYFSTGGGEVLKNNLIKKNNNFIYPYTSFKDIKEDCKKRGISDLKEIVNQYEDSDIDIYLKEILLKMLESVESGLKKEGVLPGSLKIKRIAKELFIKSLTIADQKEKEDMLLTSFAYATSENNASGEIIVTAPTCGSAGIIPAILYYYKKILNYPDQKLIDALKVASLFGNLAKENASISGAVGGCQAEIGVASSMGAVIFSYLNDLNIYQIEYAAEVALEHFLGLTCDPVKGYVQIPCIERNGIGVLRSKAAFLYAKNIAPLRKNKVSFDNVLKAMKITGDDLSIEYKETSISGLAKVIDDED